MLSLPILFPSPSLPHASVQALGTSQRGQGRGTRLVRWLGTYQHLPAAPLPFSSRPHPLKGLMHLPLSCCEMQRLKNSSTGSPGRRGEGREGAFRSRQLSGWPQWPALHLNEDKGLTAATGGAGDSQGETAASSLQPTSLEQEIIPIWGTAESDAESCPSRLG